MASFHLPQAQKNGTRHTVFWTKGEKYQGEWADNKRQGKGTVGYANKDKYEGGWVQDKREGLGTLWVFDGGKYRVRYHGNWSADKFSGEGTFYNDKGECYAGEWCEGMREGKGRQTYGGRPVDGYGGDVYEGEWQRDKRSGKGTLFLGNGDVFEGCWLDDLKHGPGTFFYTSKGRRYDGIWKEGLPKAGSISGLDAEGVGAPTLPCLELLRPNQVQRGAEREAMVSG